MRISRAVFALFSVVSIITAGACSDSEPTGSGNDPLAGLAAATRGDNAPEQAPEPDSLGPGHFEGTLYGYEPGPDTLANAVRIEGARVTAYEREERNGQVAAGDEVASVLTDAQGFWRLPTMPGGAYVVTFVPPASSPYRGGWTTAYAWRHSGDGQWHIMLPRK
jgi:hypothetical protein